jgi:hypothetical protein
MVSEFGVTRRCTPWREWKLANVASLTAKLIPPAAACSKWIPRGNRIDQPSGEAYRCRPLGVWAWLLATGGFGGPGVFAERST